MSGPGKARISAPVGAEARSLLLEAGMAEGAVVFVYPAGGGIEAVVVMSGRDIACEFRSSESLEWFRSLGLDELSLIEAEAVLFEFCEYVPRLFRELVLRGPVRKVAGPVH